MLHEKENDVEKQKNKRINSYETCKVVKFKSHQTSRKKDIEYLCYKIFVPEGAQFQLTYVVLSRNTVKRKTLQEQDLNAPVSLDNFPGPTPYPTNTNGIYTTLTP